MNKPVLSIDVAKGKSVAAAFLSYHDCMYKPFPFSHTHDDLNHLLSILEQMKLATGQELLEAIGNYSKPLVSFFSSYSYPAYMARLICAFVLFLISFSRAMTRRFTKSVTLLLLNYYPIRETANSFCRA
ncbi:hypothetical protein J2T13_005191 [Paenibacillus sp. DS2015]|uniref:hypothetical protein n=1 Tax=Paenibacillus sp. DS2015 TaxID=3373917 RepID=UPI003D21D551